jgi:hypothetical protein
MKHNPLRRCLLDRPTVEYNRLSRQKTESAEQSWEQKKPAELRKKQQRHANKNSSGRENSSWIQTSRVKMEIERRWTGWVASCRRLYFWLIAIYLFNKSLQLIRNPLITCHVTRIHDNTIPGIFNWFVMVFTVPNRVKADPSLNNALKEN